MPDYKKTALATGDAYASQNQTYSASKQKYQQGQKYYGDLSTITDDTIGEDYGPYWSANVLVDPDLKALKEVIDANAAISEDTRAARNSDFRKRVATFAIYGGPVFGAMAWAMAEVIIWIGGMLSKASAGNTPADRDAAVSAVNQLWSRWRMAPPVFAGDVMTAKGYAGVVRARIAYLDATETPETAWRERWVEVVDNAVQKALEGKSAILQEAMVSGMIPTQIEKWAPHISGLLADRPVGWGVSYEAGKDKYGNPYNSTTMTLDAMRKMSDPQAAGIGMMVAAITGKRWEPLIEVAVASNLLHAKNTGADYNQQNWRIRAVFLDTLNAAKAVPQRSALKKLDPSALAILPRASEPATGGGSTKLVAAAGLSAVGFFLLGPIGLAAGLASMLLFDDK